MCFLFGSPTEFSGQGFRTLVFLLRRVLLGLSINALLLINYLWSAPDCHMPRKRACQPNFVAVFCCVASCVLLLLLLLLLKGGQASSGADDTAGAADEPRSDIRGARRQLKGSGASGGQGGVPTGDVPYRIILADDATSMDIGTST